MTINAEFTPKPSRHYAPPVQKREDHSYAEALELVAEMNGEIIETIRTRGRIVLNCVGPLNEPFEEQFPYTLSVKEPEQIDEDSTDPAEGFEPGARVQMTRGSISVRGVIRDIDPEFAMALVLWDGDEKPVPELLGQLELTP